MHGKYILITYSQLIGKEATQSAKKETKKCNANFELYSIRI